MRTGQRKWRTMVNADRATTARPHSIMINTGYLKAFCDQDAARSAHGGLSILAFDASEKLYDVTAEFCIRGDPPDEPLQLNCLVGKYGPAIAYPELKTDHRSFGGEVRCGQSEKQRGGVCSTCDEPAYRVVAAKSGSWCTGLVSPTASA